MGVTAHFFAYDPAVYTQQPTMERWLEWGELDREMNVQPRARGWLRPISSYLGDNKRWTDNLSAQLVWSSVHLHMPLVDREPIGRLLSHLMSVPDEGLGCPCGRQPMSVAEGQTIYDHALMEHIVSLRVDLRPVEGAIEQALAQRPGLRDIVDRPHLLEFEFFEGLVAERLAIIRRAMKAGDDWSLLQWIWV